MNIPTNIYKQLAHGILHSPSEQVSVTIGTMEALAYNAYCLAVIDKGQHVIMLSRHWNDSPTTISRVMEALEYNHVVTTGRLIDNASRVVNDVFGCPWKVVFTNDSGKIKEYIK